MLYRAKVNEDSGVFKAHKTSKEVLGYELVQEFFVDNSGFGSDSEPALTAGNFLKKIKQGLYYGITGIGQFQVYIGEFKEVNRKKQFELQGISNSKLISKSCRIINFINGDKTIKLYATDILQFKGGKIVLHSGGYKITTTKTRINQFLPCGIRVYQKNHEWFIDNKGEVLEFFDGMELQA